MCVGAADDNDEVRGGDGTLIGRPIGNKKFFFNSQF